MSHPQEFAIEIPDVEADEIKTVQQGRPLSFASGLLILIPFPFNSHRLYRKNARRFVSVIFCVVHCLLFISSLREGIVLFVHLSFCTRHQSNTAFHPGRVPMIGDYSTFGLILG